MSTTTVTPTDTPPGAPAGSKVDPVPVEDIHVLEEQIREKTRILHDKKKALGDLELTHEKAETAAHEAEKELAAAQEDLRAAEQERASLMPQYERCQQNKDQHTKAEEYKQDISNAENDLKAADSTIKALEIRLQEVSSAYKSERERRALLASRIAALVDELREVVEQKIASTLSIDEADGAPNAFVCVRSLAEITREREAEVAHRARQAHELVSIIDLKRQRALELQLESQRQMSLMKAAKDEEIKALVLRFQEERANLQGDINDVREQNSQQLESLRRTRLLSEKDVVVSPSSKPDGKPSKREMAAPSDKVLVDKTKDLEKEREQLLEKLKVTSLEKQKLIKAAKDLRKQIETEEGRHTSSLRNLDNQVQNERNEILRLEKENTKLEEACNGLCTALRIEGYNPSN